MSIHIYKFRRYLQIDLLIHSACNCKQPDFVVSESAHCVRSTDAWLIDAGIIDVAWLIAPSTGLEAIAIR